jgi:hypothetical protein
LIAFVKIKFLFISSSLQPSFAIAEVAQKQTVSSFGAMRVQNKTGSPASKLRCSTFIRLFASFELNPESFIEHNGISLSESLALNSCPSS